MKKLLIFGVITLFLGLAVAPSLQADTSNEVLDGELVEVTTEFSGLDGNTTVMLTQEQVQEVDQLFDTIKEQMNNAETKEEIVEIFKEAVVELDTYGLLGGLSIRQAQRLVLGLYQYPRIMDFLEKRMERVLDDEQANNIFCLIAGKNTNYFSYPTYSWIRPIFTFFGSHVSSDSLITTFILFYELFRVFLVVPYDFPYVIRPSVLVDLVFGCSKKEYYGSSWSRYPAVGWVETFGLFLHKNITERFWGTLAQFYSDEWDYFTYSIYYVGARGFTGIHFNIKDDQGFNRFLGFALLIGLDTRRPYGE